MTTNNNPISVSNFQMRFGNKTVIEDLSFDVQPGETFGFLGSNGSGKTTTIRALLGIYQPTKGELLIDGKRYTPASSSKLGYLPEERGLYQKESVLECMLYFGQLKGVARAEARKWSMEYLERVGLTDKANEHIDHLSGGQQQKIQLGVTIINKPKLLILDEPTKGFDPVNRRLLMEIIEELTKSGTTTVMVTHQMDEVERLCDRVVLLKDGKRRLYGTVDEVRSQYGSNVIDLGFTGNLPNRSDLYSISKQTKQSAELSPKGGVDTQQVFDALANQSGLKIMKFNVQQASLDDIFLEIYGKSKEGDQNA